jgi:hypothetical protein
MLPSTRWRVDRLLLCVPLSVWHACGACRHLDADASKETLEQVFTVILYLTDGANSTAFPSYRRELFTLPKFADPAENSTDPTVSNDEQMKETVRLGLLGDQQYDYWQVRAGDMALFRQSTMHFGTENPLQAPRAAFFSIYTPFDEKRQDSHQIFR